MTVCNLEFSACRSCLTSGKTLIQLQNKLSYCCINDAANFLRPIEFTYTKLSDCPAEGVAKWIVVSSVGAVGILAFVVLIALLYIWMCKKPARTQPDEQTGLLGAGRSDYGFHFPAVQLVNETIRASHGTFELISLEEVVVEGARRPEDNQKPTTNSFKANHLKTVV